MVQAALLQLQRDIEQRQLHESAALYAEVYAEDDDFAGAARAARLSDGLNDSSCIWQWQILTSNLAERLLMISTCLSTTIPFPFVVCPYHRRMCSQRPLDYTRAGS